MVGIDATHLAAADAHDDPGRLSQELAELLFSKELACGCATKPRKPGIQQLDIKNASCNQVCTTFSTLMSQLKFQTLCTNYYAHIKSLVVNVAHRFQVENGFISPEKSKR